MNNESNRDNWIRSSLDKLSGSILDVGAGEQRYKNDCSHLKYVSQDKSKYSGQGNGEGLQTKEWNTKDIDIISDIIKIPVEDNKFDNVLCTEVLEHIPYPEKAIEEIARILKPKGKLVITAPFCSLTHFAPEYFANGYSKYWYEKILPKYGLKIEEIDINGNYFAYIAQEVGRIENMVDVYSEMNIFTRGVLKLAVKNMLRLLRAFEKKDQGSEAVLCFGIGVLATKI